MAFMFAIKKNRRIYLVRYLEFIFSYCRPRLLMRQTSLVVATGHYAEGAVSTVSYSA